MIFLLLLILIPAVLLYYCLLLGNNMYSRLKTDHLLESVTSREDLIYMPYKDFVNVMAEVFRRKGHKVRLTNKCGEDGNGLILNELVFVEVWKHSPHHYVEIETAIKLHSRMDHHSIYRGMLITSGNFKESTRIYCHKNVIECINSDQLLAMCKEVQRRNLVTEAY